MGPNCPVPHRSPLNPGSLLWSSSRRWLAHLHAVPQPLTFPVSSAPIINAFSLFLQNLAYEIILTLGQAFEVAYQLALQARKGGHSSTLPESFENKPSKPIPKPRVSIRKSVVSRRERHSRNLQREGEGAVWCGCHLEFRAFPSRSFPLASSWLVIVIVSAWFLQSLEGPCP